MQRLPQQSLRALQVLRDNQFLAISKQSRYRSLLRGLPDRLNRVKQILRDQPLDCPIARIGELIADHGLFQQSAGTKRKPLEPAGWQY